MMIVLFDEVGCCKIGLKKGRSETDLNLIEATINYSTGTEMKMNFIFQFYGINNKSFIKPFTY